eukprot:5910677-Lingulodinium_polyedra.AAC.1
METTKAPPITQATVNGAWLLRVRPMPASRKLCSAWPPSRAAARLYGCSPSTNWMSRRRPLSVRG